MMVLDKINLPKAYKEVIKIIEYLPEEEYKKIPQAIISNLKQEMDKDYEYEINDIDNITMLKETEEIMAVLYRDYLATEEERKKIILQEEQEERELEEEKRRKYSPENIFEQNKKECEIEDIFYPIKVQKTKMNIFSRFINFLKSIKIK